MLSLDKIYHAAFILKSVARKTDLIAAPHLSEGNNLYLKTENLQVTGSFKVRGAYYKISQLTPEEASKGVIACSAGNHAQGVALAATSMGIKSVICMPDGAPIMKVENTKRLGAQVELVPGAYDEAHDRAVQLQEETGMTFIHPYDDELVIAGQGSIGLEILDQLPDVEAVIVPIGGGGLISGRRADLVIALQDRPGQLREVSEIVSSCGANVVGVQHNRSDADMDITGCFLRLELETRDAEQINEIRAKLTKAGFTLIDKNAAHY